MIRAVIYARCSTEEESQRDALAKQVAQAKECVEKKGWLLVDSYVESCSGTSTKGRIQYNRLYEDLQRDNFEVVVVKSQDRLMRNVKDWYLFADRLLTMQKQLYLYMEQKFYCTDDALLTGIKAILAEEYSRELSQKMNHAHRNRQKNGGAVILTSNTYGYRKMPDKSVVIMEEEAAIKKRMYELCAAGYGCRRISHILQEDGIVNRKGKYFSDSDILRMIRNPINKGTVVMNRTHYDFDSKTLIKIPKEEQYVYEDKIPAIVSKELWNQANQAIEKRKEKIQKEEKKESARQTQRGRNRGTYLFSGKLFCGFCHQPYYRCTRKQYRDKEKIYEWKCRCYLERGRLSKNKEENKTKEDWTAEQRGCNNIYLEEKKLTDLLEQIFEKRSSIDRTKISQKMLQLSKEILMQKEKDFRIEEERKKEEYIRQQMNKLVDKLLEGVISDTIYQEKQKELEDKRKESIERIRKMKKQETVFPQKRFLAIEQFLKDENQIQKAQVAQRLEEIEKIVIYPCYMEIWFKEKKETERKEKQEESENSVGFLKINYNSFFQYQKQKEEERKKILEQIKKQPQITAKQIAKQLNIGISKVRYQMEILKKQNRIYFEGKGGKGRWKTPDDRGENRME